MIMVPQGLKSKSMKKLAFNKPCKRHLSYDLLKLVPNVRRFRVDISDYDPLFKKHGIDKRLEPTLVYEPYDNKSANRYLKHQYRRMTFAARVNPLLFWRIGMHLVRRSNVFLVTAINHVLPKWHRDIKLTSVIKLARMVKWVARCDDTQIQVSRTYIDKANGGIRGLGVPTQAWRVYLHMLNTVLTWYLELSGKAHDAQHGFRPRRGTLTAWTKILEEVIHSKDIYEFDLKNFFPSVNLDYISVKLIEKGVPTNIVQRLYYINCGYAVVKNGKYRLNEFEEMMKKLIMKGKTLKEVVTAPRPISYLYRVRGVPQGAPTSPVLATLALENSILDRPGLKAVMYADDGIYYGDIDQPIITPNSGMVTANISFNLNKSGWVKRDGVWLKPLKFLGKEFDGKELRASTRKGSTLVYDKQDLIKDIITDNRNTNSWEFKDVKDNKTWEDLIKSKLFGFIQSRMYAGSWNLEDFFQNFEYSFKRGSWSDKRGKGKNINVFNSTSFASKWLIKKLSTLKPSGLS